MRSREKLASNAVNGVQTLIFSPFFVWIRAGFRVGLTVTEVLAVFFAENLLRALKRLGGAATYVPLPVYGSFQLSNTGSFATQLLNERPRDSTTGLLAGYPIVQCV